MTDDDSEPQDPVDFGLQALMGEFTDLDLKRQQADRDAWIWHRESRWTRLVTWLKAHPGEKVELENIHSNAVQRLKKRYPGLRVTSTNNHFEPPPKGSKRARGRKVCNLHLMWPVEGDDA